ncbi:hypothetical protein F8M41_017265 [Gigaspora margarita]|uniref:Uncharacterized protein n=1 Tax=Gigaspora margarita TaxID=4874 RepID=A0A8H4ANG8_GIGMA|nr:hypothetical protein F8M41_017265 [Gigaspora margarita]
MKTKFKDTESNIQVTSSDDELEILNHDINQNIEQDKENEHFSDIMSNKNYNKTTIVNEYNNDDDLEFFNSSYFNNFYYHESASSRNNKTTENVTFQTNEDIIIYL